MSIRKPTETTVEITPPGPLMARGLALGGWLGTALATQAALRFGHSPMQFLLDLGLTCLPLALLGAFVGYLAAISPADSRMRIREARPVNEDELRNLVGR